MIKFLLFFLILISYSKSQLSFENPKFYSNLVSANLSEVSGIVKSKQHNIFWVHNDSGGETAIFGIDTIGNILCKITIPYANRDWEDITYGQVNGKYYIFLGEIGDNDLQFATKIIYMFEEPTLLKNSISLSVSQVDKIEFMFEHASDCETLFFNPINQNLYLITKGQVQEQIYEITYPYETKKVLQLQSIGKLTIKNDDKNMLNRIVGGDISNDGKYLTIKDYTTIFYYEINGNVKYITTHSPFTLPLYKQMNEPQGEAVCWGSTNYDIYTLGEEVFGIQARIQYFKNVNATNVKKKSKNKFQ